MPAGFRRGSRDAPRGAVAIITSDDGQVLLHLGDDIPGIAWPGHWSVLGGGADPGETPHEAIVRELAEEAGLVASDLAALFEVVDEHGSRQIITFFAGTWNGDETALPLAEGVKLRFVDPAHLATLTIPPYIRDGIARHLDTRACPSDVSQAGCDGLKGPPDSIAGVWPRGRADRHHPSHPTYQNLRRRVVTLSARRKPS